MSLHSFGRTADGAQVDEVKLALANGTVASFIAFGAVWRDLVIPVPGNGPRRVTLGFRDLAGYEADHMQVGASLGRCGNRTANGRFTLDGKTYRLPLNEKGRTHLHGGVKGFSRRVWTIDAHDDASVSMSLVSPDGEEGYPGRATARCVYRLLPPATVRIEYSATADAPTLVNLANHAYFTLDYGKSIRGHRLTLNCSRYTPSVPETLLPTGVIAPVEGTVYDFRQGKPLLHPSGDDAFMFDMNFVIDRSGPGMVHAATVDAPGSPVRMEVHTTEPGLQLYDASGMAPGHPGLDGNPFFKNAGFCLEAQKFPDSANHPDWPTVVLRPGETYSTTTEYRFIAG
jgi:aldose 1-epimerase